MHSSFRFAVAVLLAVLAAGPLPAQFMFHREYFGRPGSLRGPGPFVRLQAAPVVIRQVRQEPRQDDEGPRSDAGKSRSDIQITANVAGDNEAVKQAIAECRRWLDREQADVGAFRVSVGRHVVLRVGKDPENRKPDLADVLPSREVAWNYPPENLFEIIHEDTTRAVLVLAPKAAGTYTVTAVVLSAPEPVPLPAKPPEAKEDLKKKKDKDKKADSEALPKPAPVPGPAKSGLRFVNFTIQVDGTPAAPVPGTVPPAITPPASLEAALQAVKAAYQEERKAKGIELLKVRLTKLSTDNLASQQTLNPHINAAKNVNPTSKALRAIREALAVPPIPVDPSALRTRLSQIVQQLQ
ncbi:MAG: hypothetical protein L0Y70_29455 [Gemmataceae bacterium]|nr:hypothetical protein [Gemmataceae bacterium]